MTQAFEFRRPEGVQVTYRRTKFDFEDHGFERYWHGGSAFRSLFWSQLSTAFEPGETFFIDAARALRKQLNDPRLLAELTEFFKQEGHHSAQHLKFDRINAALGVDVERCARRYKHALADAREQMGPMEMLAATVALEHLTSCFADQFFKNPELMLQSADPAVTALWAWHAAEEAEHRGTCFDIYKALGGSYGMRIGILFGTWTMLLGLSLYNTTSLLRRDGQLWTRDTLSGIGYLFGRRGLITGLTRPFLAYLNPRFHPWRGVTAEAGAGLGARWLAENMRYVTNNHANDERTKSRG